ncbi:MAG TPA: nickel-dependent hydrogenase large subunit, partial [Clostridia bacterium]|nr:nickel-dependent hydrogenase large subunit [Clostridia bacterium]
MAQKVVIDPITRIEGHLKIEVLVENGQVTDAWTVGTAARGFEILLRGKDPRDATYVTERVCGVCAGPHGWASSVA